MVHVHVLPVPLLLILVPVLVASPDPSATQKIKMSVKELASAADFDEFVAQETITVVKICGICPQNLNVTARNHGFESF